MSGPESSIVLYTTPDGAVKIDAIFQNETIWLIQAKMAELFDCSSDNISLHLKNIYEEQELLESSTTEDFSVVQKNEDTDEWEEQWTGDYIFEKEWQSFRTKKDRSLEMKSVFHECARGRRKIAVKVVDFFGNDTMTIVEVTV